MMAAVEAEIDLDKLNRLIRIFAGFTEKSAEAFDEALEAGAQAIEDMAVTLVPIRTGRLRDSIHHERKAPLNWIVTAGGPDVPYAKFVEYGTVKMAARSFMRASAEGRRQEVNQIIRRKIRELLGI